MDESAITVELQLADDLDDESKIELPTVEKIEQWLLTTFVHLKSQPAENTIAASKFLEKKLNPELSIRVVCAHESQTLNQQYRQKDKPTNVLSFESDLPNFIPSNFIGDLVICAKVVKDEAKQQNKPLSKHWAHMCVHGTLHLLGYDHITSSDATQMETLEVEILAKLGIDDPYLIS